MSLTVTIFCECNSAHCLKRIQVSVDEYEKWTDGHVFVSSDCTTPPEAGDVKVGEGEGFVIYQERGRAL